MENRYDRITDNSVINALPQPQTKGDDSVLPRRSEEEGAGRREGHPRWKGQFRQMHRGRKAHG